MASLRHASPRYITPSGDHFSDPIFYCHHKAANAGLWSDCGECGSGERMDASRAFDMSLEAVL